jgi:class 3 adenylate cyclase/TolB-like protein
VTRDSVERRLAAILAADAVGYSRLMAQDEVATVATLNAHRDTMSELVLRHGGRVVDIAGDNLLAEFPSALEAVACAVEIQRQLGDANAGVPRERRLRFRIGIHLGDVMVEGPQIYGDGINIAARLEGLSEPGGVCVSGSVHDQVQSKLDVEYEDLGPQSIKNIPTPIRVYRLRTTGVVAEVRIGLPQRRRRALAAGALVAVAGIVALWQLGSPVPGASPQRIRSVAVLPLDNLSGNPEQEYFTDGMTEALISDLAKIGSLRVISRTSAMQYRGVRKPLPEIARELNVDAVVEGSVLRAGDVVRITAQLIDARSDMHLWSESYQRELRNVGTLQGDVARTIARAIELTLSPREQALLAHDRPVEPSAYEAYLKGRYFLEKPTRADHARAIEYFEQSVREDPDYAPAWAGLADAYT